MQEIQEHFDSESEDVEEESKQEDFTSSNDSDIDYFAPIRNSKNQL